MAGGTGAGVAERFDPFGDAYQQDPPAALAEARRHQPVFHSPLLDMWVVTRYHDIKAALHDSRRFSAANALDPITPLGTEARELLNGYGFAPGPVLVNEDPPRHLPRRKLLAPPLAAPEIEPLEGRIRALVTGYIDAFADRGRADLIQDLVWEVPAVVGLLVAGVPDEYVAQARGYAVKMGLFTWGRPTGEHQMEIADQVGRWWTLAGELVDLLRREKGTGWIPHAIEMQREHPDVISDNQLQNMMMSGLVAAHETTTNATANALKCLLTQRDAWAALCADPSAVPNAVEESLRHSTSVLCWRRRTNTAVTLGGVDIPAQSPVLLMIGSGNHDADVFPDPERFDIHRPNAKRHLSFGIGSHACLGAPLARLEMRIILEELTRRLPGLRLAPGTTFTYPPNASFHGPLQLPVEWD
ncbi:cytochrome P450 [Streptomyces sp. NPDC086554]|uniref:cytochrome P450 n=1 Tax=Streptomyces sp. NPDC086554 TaxID=3154864 RepID=UPI00342728E0